MANTFQTIYEDLMDHVSRPTSDTTVLAKAKRCVNNAVLTNLGHSNHTTALHKYVAFLEGADLGLYPTPTSSVNLRLFICDWLVDLASDGDTNFILTFGYRAVYLLALQELMLFLNMGSDYPYTENELNKAQSSFYAWDSSQLTGDLNSL